MFECITEDGLTVKVDQISNTITIDNKEHLIQRIKYQTHKLDCNNKPIGEGTRLRFVSTKVFNHKPLATVEYDKHLLAWVIVPDNSAIPKMLLGYAKSEDLEIVP